MDDLGVLLDDSDRLRIQSGDTFFFALDTNSRAKRELDIEGRSVKDINLFLVGSRVKFN